MTETADTHSSSTASTSHSALRTCAIESLLIENGASNARPVQQPPAFAAGDRVRGRELPESRHARIPRYAQGRVGTVEVVHEAFVFPDTNLSHAGENPEHVYAVRFRARELWPDADEQASVLVDLWESYLQPA